MREDVSDDPDVPNEPDDPGDPAAPGEPDAPDDREGELTALEVSPAESCFAVVHAAHAPTATQATTSRVILA